MCIDYIKERVAAFEKSRERADSLDDFPIWRPNEDLVEIPYEHDSCKDYANNGIGVKGCNSLFVPFDKYHGMFFIRICQPLTEEGERRLITFDKELRNTIKGEKDNMELPLERWYFHKKWIKHMKKEWETFNPAKFVALNIGNGNIGFYR